MNRNPTPHDVSRRSFVKIVMAFLGTAMAGIIGIPAIGYLISPASRKPESDAWIPLGPLGNYPIGVPIRFNFTRSVINGWEKSVNSHGVFVVRQDESQVRVFSNICTHLGCRVSWHTDLQHYVSPCHNGHFDIVGTHLGCRVSWHTDLQHYVSPCHNGHFDIVGTVKSGPPPRPLDEFTTKVEAGNLYILYPPYERAG